MGEQKVGNEMWEQKKGKNSFKKVWKPHKLKKKNPLWIH